MHGARDAEDTRLLETGDHKTLLAGYFHPVRQRCLLRLRDPDAADEVTQAVFLRLISELARGRAYPATHDKCVGADHSPPATGHRSRRGYGSILSRQASAKDSSLFVRYRRHMAVTPSRSVPSAPPTGAIGLRLNMLPVDFPPGVQKDVVFSVPYADSWLLTIDLRSSGVVRPGVPRRRDGLR